MWEVFPGNTGGDGGGAGKGKKPVKDALIISFLMEIKSVFHKILLLKYTTQCFLVYS